jgi:hypothetical protein
VLHDHCLPQLLKQNTGKKVSHISPYQNQHTHCTPSFMVSNNNNFIEHCRPFTEHYNSYMSGHFAAVAEVTPSQ